MPELPEVETVVRIIRPTLRGHKILDAQFTVPRQLEPLSPLQLRKAIRGQTISSVRRRGKYILIDLDRGTLIVHLRMTGTLYVRPPQRGHLTHERSWFRLDNGQELVFRDPRTLGTVTYTPAERMPELLAKLGWEPLSDSVGPDVLRERLAARRIGIKPLLLNQSLWAGIGNIYASEILWEARVNPEKPANRLTREECERIIRSVRTVLKRAVEKGGSSIRNFMSPDGEAGAYQKQFRVYDRAGLACQRCGGEISRIVQAQRSTYFCKVCQKRK